MQLCRPLLACLLLAHAAASAAQRDPPRVVLLAERGDDSGREAAIAVSAQLSDLPIRVAIVSVDRLPHAGQALNAARRLAAQHNALAVVWSELDPEGVSNLYIVRRRGRLLVRTIETEGAGRVEGLAVIARVTLQAMLSGGIGAQKSTHGGRFGLELGYRLDIVSSSAPISHGLMLSASLRLVPGIHLFATFGLVSETEAASELVRMQLRRYPWTVGLRLCWQLGRLGLAGAASVGAVHVVRTTQATSPDIVAIGDEAATLLTVSPSGRVSVRLSPRTQLFGEVSAHWLVNQQRYLVQVGGQRQTLITPFVLQPGLQAGLAVTLP